MQKGMGLPFNLSPKNDNFVSRKKVRKMSPEKRGKGGTEIFCYLMLRY
jgi:hypothetical protein